MENSRSYDPRMDDLPVLISYPRSGSNYFNCLAELYFDRPRLRNMYISLLDSPNREDFMWFHDHDRFSQLRLAHDRIAYLYRNPEDVIYSLLVAESKTLTTESVNEQIGCLERHYDKYLLSGMSAAIIRYETLLSDLPNEFAKFVNFLTGESDVDKDRLMSANQKVTKNAIINKAKDKKYFNNNMLTKAYDVDRAEFKNRYKKHIRDALIIEPLEDFFYEP